MFHKILVALDKSEFRKPVFHEALDLAKVCNSTLKLLHVLSLEEQDDLSIPISTTRKYFQAFDNRILEIYQERWDTWEAQGLELLRSLQSQANDAGVSAEILQYSGTPGKIICDVARSWEADLIVLGRRGYSGIKELLLGSASNYVLHHAPCSVLIVQGSILHKTEVTEETASVSH